MFDLDAMEKISLTIIAVCLGLAWRLWHNHRKDMKRKRLMQDAEAISSLYMADKSKRDAAGYQ